MRLVDPPQWPQVIAVVGGGRMGSGIAEAFAAGRVEVRITDATPELSAQARERVVDRARSAVEKGLVDATLLERVERVRACESIGEAVAGAEFVLEAVAEDLGVKDAVLAETESAVADDAVVATAHGVFGSLRNELWALEGAAWVLAGATAAGPLYREPPADAFFARTVELAPLSPADAAKLLRAHAPELSDVQIAETLAAEDSGNPRGLLRAAADIQAGISPTASVIDALAERAEQAAGPLAGRLVSYLADHVPASASDERLLRQVGAQSAAGEPADASAGIRRTA